MMWCRSYCRRSYNAMRVSAQYGTFFPNLQLRWWHRPCYKKCTNHACVGLSGRDPFLESPVQVVVSSMLQERKTMHVSLWSGRDPFLEPSVQVVISSMLLCMCRSSWDALCESSVQVMVSSMLQETYNTMHMSFRLGRSLRSSVPGGIVHVAEYFMYGS